MTKRQRNAIYATLTANGLEPDSCDLSDLTVRSGLSQANLLHRPSGSQFTLWRDDAREDLYSASMVVGTADSSHLTEAVWNLVLEGLAAWAQEVKYETDAPDLWAGLGQVPDVLTSAQAAEASNTPFTPNEQATISDRLDEIKDLVREQFELNADQLRAIDRRVDELKEASQRLGRKDWLLIFYGGLVSTFMTDAMPPNVIQTILTTVVHGIAHIFGFGGPPPIIST